MQKNVGGPVKQQWSRDLEEKIRESLSSIRFGSVTLVIQDGKVIQIDRNEKIRLAYQGHINGSGI